MLFKPGLTNYAKESVKQEKKQVTDTRQDALTFAGIKQRDEIDEKMGFAKFLEGQERLGWLVNIQETLIDDGSCADGRAGIDLYFFQDDGSSFKASVLYDPFFYILCSPGSEVDVEEFLKRKFPKQISSMEVVEKEDLDLANHLTGKRQRVLKVVFPNNEYFRLVKQFLQPIVTKNQTKETNETAFDSIFESESFQSSKMKKVEEAIDSIMELREHDLLYYTRVTIDKDLRVGLWYNVKPVKGVIVLEPRPDILRRADPIVFAFDIETSKLPLRFPDASFDSIMMISYMIDGQGYLITNREIVSSDIDDFDFTPKPEYPGSFQIFNEPSEKALLERFFRHIVLAHPTVFVTYNGDFFDWGFIDTRAKIHGMDMYQEIGFAKNSSGEYLSSYGMHMDCFYWVKRDSYLPQGSQNLKAVATYKLGYNPVELDPEDMTRYAAEKPQILAQYSVSDAVATYYLYMKYVHPFTFSLCNIIPMHPDDVLRRGSGTLCEHLLMVQAFKANVIMPNKHSEKNGKFFNGHLLNSETYVGGHVEALEAGVFRSDIPIKFKLNPDAFQQLIDEIDNALKFSLTTEGGIDLEQVENYDQVRQSIIDELIDLRDRPTRLEPPLIYHLDVGAMYPNIILTNRLQPDAIVTDEICASCDYNEGPESSCQRRMTWSWRGEHFVSTRGEYNMLRNQLEQEKFPAKRPNGPERSFHELPHVEQESLVKKRMSDYTRKVYGKTYATKVIDKESIVCQRENAFYVNTVRAFRDRRYEYKALLKSWKKKLEKAIEEGDAGKIDEASKMIVLYDSLQTAHKCILNSFYGYVMRKGARWYSMEMAGIVCLTGAKIIQLARQRVEQIGRPLELDTDGIWCVLPKSFPENVTFELKGGKSYTISYPCVMLNHLVHDQFTNDQYQEWNEEKQEYVIRKENSIFFEVDGPYRAMILPASTEEDKLLKKRYAVFNNDGTIAELKGFEVKRRGELKLIKNFQSSIFKVFLEGTTLEECYAAVAAVSNRWIDILHSKGSDLTDVELFDLVSENRSMSKSLEQYGTQKSTSITTAKRLAEFLGEQMVQDKGLNCKFIISKKPNGAPVSERAIPVAIFQSEESVQRHFLRKWLKDSAYRDDDIRELIDWDYYLERFGSVIQKLITIPAASQDVANPIPRIVHPEWLLKRLALRDSKFKQRSITDFAKPREEKDRTDSDEDVENQDPSQPQPNEAILVDMEDVFKPPARLANGKRHMASRVYLKREQEQEIAPGKARKKIKLKKGKVRVTAENPHDPFNNYVAWMLAQQPIWERKLKQKRRLGLVNTGDGITSYFKNTVATLGTETWELLQVSETDSQGIFRLWVIVNGRMESIDIDVPRIIYLNSTCPDPNEDIIRPGLEMIKRVRTLPRNHACLHLYELRMTEYYYRTHANTFSSMFNHKDVEGVYETQVPLLVRALIQLGMFAKLDIPIEMFDKTRPLPLDHLAAVKKPSSYYLSKGAFDVIYIFHAYAGSRHLIGTFQPFTAQVHVFVVDPGKNIAQLPSVRRAYGECFDARDKSLDDVAFFDYPPAVEPKSSVYGTENEALEALNGLLLKVKGVQNKPIVLLVQSSATLQYYRKSGVAAFREFPSMVIPTHKSDNEFPGLGWQQYAANRMMNNCFNLVPFLKDRIDIARYGNLPLCNIETDYIVFISDILMARRLKQADTLLWCSLSSKPDLGGSEQEDYSSSYSDFKFPEVNNPGAYETMTIALDLFDLPLNTLIRSVEFKGDLDNVTALSNKASIHLLDSHFAEKDTKVIARADYTDMENPHSALSFLRSMIKDWLSEVRKQNHFASTFLDHLHRWITSPSSLMHDPMIVSYIHNMMKRSFAQLLEELQRLGSQVIYATFNKIVLKTSKTNIQSSIGYIHYVIAAIGKNASFEHVELKPTGFWDYLFWLDSFNYGGIAYQIEEGSVVGDPIPDFRFNIGDYLPPLVQNIYLQTIAEYLYVVHQAKQNSETFHETLRSYVDSGLKRKLLQTVDDFHHKRIPDENMEEHPYQFPHLPGLNKVFHNAALEFIKSFIAILQLDTNLEDQVRSLNRDLLRLIDVREFQSDAVFSNPCEKYVLTQVICEYCNFCCDLDLTRKLSLADSFLSCKVCNMQYSKDDMELLLIAEVQKIISKWQLQDIQCVSCRLIRAEELAEVCARCTGQIETVYKKPKFKTMLQVLSNIADFYRMENLQEYCQFVTGFE